MKIAALGETLPVYGGSFQGLGSLLAQISVRSGPDCVVRQTPLSAVQRHRLRGARDDPVRAAADHRTVCGSNAEAIIARLRRQRLEYQLRRHRDRRFERAIDRTLSAKKPWTRVAVPLCDSCGLQFQDDVDAADHEHIVLQLNFADRFRHQSLIRSIYLTRLQRASEGSGQSTRRGSDNVIQGSGVRFQNRGRNLVVLRHRAMHSEYDRLVVPPEDTLCALGPSRARCAHGTGKPRRTLRSDRITK